VGQQPWYETTQEDEDEDEEAQQDDEEEDKSGTAYLPIVLSLSLALLILINTIAQPASESTRLVCRKACMGLAGRWVNQLQSTPSDATHVSACNGSLTNSHKHVATHNAHGCKHVATHNAHGCNSCCAACGVGCGAGCGARCGVGCGSLVMGLHGAFCRALRE
jgi:hypothetical protein